MREFLLNLFLRSCEKVCAIQQRKLVVLANRREVEEKRLYLGIDHSEADRRWVN